jgi:hypothetical protein
MFRVPVPEDPALRSLRSLDPAFEQKLKAMLERCLPVSDPAFYADSFYVKRLRCCFQHAQNSSLVSRPSQTSLPLG